MHFHFPREISKLRAAYEQDNIFGYSGSSNAVKTELHLSLGGSTIEDDTVHTFSGNQSAAAEESGMVQLARHRWTIASYQKHEVKPNRRERHSQRHQHQQRNDRRERDTQRGVQPSRRRL